MAVGKTGSCSIGRRGLEFRCESQGWGSLPEGPAKGETSQHQLVNLGGLAWGRKLEIEPANPTSLVC